MIYYDRIDLSEGIDVNKKGKSKACDICHYWYFLNKEFKFRPNVRYRCHDLLMMSRNLSEWYCYFKHKSADYNCIINEISKT